MSARPEAELRYATVLFADLVGFTAFSESRSADEVGEVVAAVLSRLYGVLRRHGGTTEKYLGDAVLSTFGLREPDPKAALSATRAGLELQASMAEYRHETHRDLHLRVGVHCGELMVRRIDDTWAVVGDVVNTAARLQDIANPDTVWISRSVYDEVRPYVEVLPRPSVSLKGKSLPMQPYEVRREHIAASSPTLPFTGRTAESAALAGELARAQESSTVRVVVVRGAAGVGKTRLVNELFDRLEADERLYRVDRIEYDRADVSPAGGLAGLIRHRFRLTVDDDEATALAALYAAADQELPHRSDDRPLDFLAFLLGLVAAGKGVASLDGEAVWIGAYAAVHDWVQSKARIDPWVLAFEDVQFGDPETAAFLDWSLTVGWNAPVLVVITVREEGFSDASEWHDHVTRWVADGKALELNLHELGTEDLTAALLALPDSVLSPAAAARIAEHAEGHPLFALELVDLLTLDGARIDEASLASTVLPGTVREAMEARIERLGLEGKQLAKRGAFIGRRFTREGVARLWDGGEVTLERGLEILRSSRTVFEEALHGTDGSIEYVFRHGRLQEAALARVPAEERLRWHHRLEEWANGRLDAAPDDVDRLGPDVIPMIARSRVAHDDDPGAADWYEVLGLLHRRQHHSSEASQAFLAAASRTHGTRRHTLRMRAAAAVSVWGDVGRALAILDEPYDDLVPTPRPANPLLTGLAGETLDRWWDTDREEAMLTGRLQRADLLSRGGQLHEAQEEFIALGESLLNLRSPHATELHFRWGRAYVFFLSEIQGLMEQARAVRARCAALVAPDQPVPHDLLVMDDGIAMRSGEMVAAEQTARTRLERALRSGDLIEESVSWNSLGIVLTSLGDLAGSQSAYEHSLRLARDTGDLRGEAISLHNLGILYLDRGEHDQAQALHEEYHALSLRIGNWMAESYAPIYLALVAADRGDDSGAHRMLLEAADAADRHGWPRLSALAQAMSGEVKVLRGARTSDVALLRAGRDAILEHEQGWLGLDDVGELYATAAIASNLLGEADQAAALLVRFASAVHPSWTMAGRWLDAAGAVVDGRDIATHLEWLRQHDFVRASAILAQLADATSGTGRVRPRTGTMRRSPAATRPQSA